MEQKNEAKYVLLSNNDRKCVQLFCGGLLAVDFLFIQGYLSITQLDSFERIAMDCFMAAMPFLVVFAVTANLLNVHLTSRLLKICVFFLFCFAVITNGYGLMNAFWHFSYEIGNIFFASSIFAVFLMGKVFMPLPKQ